MSLSSNSPFNTRILKDINYIVSSSVPAIGQVATSASLATSSATPALDFIQAVPYPVTSNVVVRVDVSALTNTSNSLASTYKLQDSADNVSFADIGQFSTSLVSVTDSAGSASAANASVVLPPSCRRYVRVMCSIPATGSNAGGITGSTTASVLF